MLIGLIGVSVLILILMLPSDYADTTVGIVAYIIPFYTLVASCVRLYETLHSKISDIKNWVLAIPVVEKICSIPIVERYRIDILFKSQIRLYFSIAINIGYIAINVLTYYLYHSVWFLVIAAYYSVLFGMCVILYRFHKKVGFGINRIDDLRITRFCSIILLTLNVILLIAIRMIIYRDAGYHYEGIVIYFMAAYTFFTSGLAIINLIRFSKYGNFVVTIIRAAVVAAALVSILTLETAMLFQFGADMPKDAKELLVVFSGIGISTVIVGMAMRLIALTSDEIRELKMQESVEE